MKNLVDFLTKNKLQVVCKSHLQESHDSFNTYSWTYSLEDEKVWQFGQNEKPCFPNREEMQLGVAEILMSGKTCTIVQHSDEDQIFIR
jgi:hypothetical protein